MTEIVIGSRGSALALTQTNWVAERIKLHNPGIEPRIEIIKTKGDKILDTPLAKIGDKGLFVKEIESALSEGRIDLAVHSMKDLPSEMMEGLVIGAVPKRVDPSDVLLSLQGGLTALPTGAKIGSSSLRRKAQILNFRSDLEFRDLRGNLDTRIRKLQDGEYDAIIVAYAGLLRLKWDGEITQKIPFDVCLPAVGQGALAVQVRGNDERTARVVAPLDDKPSHIAITAERALLAALGGGCQIPIGGVAVADEDRLVLSAMVASLDGKQIIRTEEADSIENVEVLGKRAAEALLDSGAREILSTIREADGFTSMGAP